MSQYLNASWISQYFGVSIGDDYERFLRKEHFEAFTGYWGHLPSYNKMQEIWLMGEGLESFLHDDWPEDRFDYGHPSALEMDFTEFPGWVPLATFGCGEAQILVVKADHKDAPVAMWEHETNELVPVAPTLADFLGSLTRYPW